MSPVIGGRGQKINVYIRKYELTGSLADAVYFWMVSNYKIL